MWQKSDFYANESGYAHMEKISNVCIRVLVHFDGADSPTGTIEIVPVGLYAP